ncbi:Alpha/Beta hydrolase fold [Phytophthora cactorum]|nr:Alpha/Beta hydrolase fold [Phytophthora cactorum]
MQLSLVMLMVMAGAIGHTSAASNGTLNHPFNGWYPYQEYTFRTLAALVGMLSTSEFADPTVDIFVKRIQASAGDTKTAHNVWLLQGGPGYASAAIRCLTVAAHDKFYVGFSMKYGDLASFSTTSAAMDILPFISKYSNGASSIVYGVSYGTVVVERLMHLNPPTVNGYALDGIATASGASGNKFEY